MKERLSALPGGAADAGADFGLVPAHMTYEIAAGPKLTGIGLTPDIRGGAMLIACSGGRESGEPQYCCRQVLGECLRRGFDRVILGYEGDAGPAAQRLAAGLGRMQNRLEEYRAEAQRRFRRDFKARTGVQFSCAALLLILLF